MDSDVHAGKSSAGTLAVVESSGNRRAHFLQEFGALVNSGRAVPLDEAMLLISATLTGDLDVIGNLVMIDELASQVASPTLEGIARHLFTGEEAFAGNALSYYDPENSLLDKVLERRLGIPITLSILMIEVGRRLGVSLSAVGMPGHFLVGTQAPMGKVPAAFVDPYHSGMLLDVDGCRSLFGRMTGTATTFDVRFLASLHPIAVLDRATNNLKGIYQAKEDSESLRWIMALRSRLPGLGRAERDEFFRLMAPFN